MWLEPGLDGLDCTRYSREALFYWVGWDLVYLGCRRGGERIFGCLSEILFSLSLLSSLRLRDVFWFGVYKIHVYRLRSIRIYIDYNFILLNCLLNSSRYYN